MEASTLDKHNYKFGDNLYLSIKFVHNGDPNPDSVYMNQELMLDATYDTAVFNLCGSILTPERLRQVADEIEVHMAAAKEKVPAIIEAHNAKIEAAKAKLTDEDRKLLRIR